MPGLEKGAQNGNKLGKIYKNTIVALKDYNERKYVGLVETPKNERKIKRVAEMRDHLKLLFRKCDLFFESLKKFLITILSLKFESVVY